VEGGGGKQNFCGKNVAIMTFLPAGAGGNRWPGQSRLLKGQCHKIYIVGFFP
jgi:hypothetical protein